jgi:hypothetical protein
MRAWKLLRPIADSVRTSAPMCSSIRHKSLKLDPRAHSRPSPGTAGESKARTLPHIWGADSRLFFLTWRQLLVAPLPLLSGVRINQCAGGKNKHNGNLFINESENSPTERNLAANPFRLLMHTIHPVAFFLSRATSRWIDILRHFTSTCPRQISSQFLPVGTHCDADHTSSASLVISADAAIKQNPFCLHFLIVK